ncbi:hypothetical protein Sjap_023024 [Stephania japonica]|uniref:Uncharacterized protein n=1 Tax=Stephania japonica TaxID=461633 RepID=A0AAP0HU53_9MAGN
MDQRNSAPQHANINQKMGSAINTPRYSPKRSNQIIPHTTMIKHAIQRARAPATGRQTIN